MEIRRALEWIHHDRHDYWDHEVRRSWDRITEARVQLQQARTTRRIGDHDPACVDEKKALARAQQRLEIAQKKVVAVRHCTQAIDHAVDEYRGARTPLASWLDSEALKAVASLRRMMDSLDAYLAQDSRGGGMGARSRERGAWSREQGARRNPKSQTRNPKQIRKYEHPMSETVLNIPHLSFEFVSDFDIRISCFVRLPVLEGDRP